MRLLHQLPPNTYDDDLALRPRDGPEAVLGLVADVTEAALAANLYLLHPTDVDLAGGRARVALASARPERSVSMGPEVLRDGPVPATLTYSVAAIAALATLGTIEMAPDEPEPHAVWVAELKERLAGTWAGLPGADAAVELVARSLAFDVTVRPHPKNVVEEVTRIRALLARPPDAEPEPAAAPAPVTAPRTSASGAPPIVVPLSHPLVPYAMVTTVLAALALGVALCTLGAVMGQFADLLGKDPPPTFGRANSPRAPAAVEPAPVPAEQPIDPASMLDRFERTSLAEPSVVVPLPVPVPLPDPVVARPPERAVAPPPVDRLDPRPRPDPVDRPKAAPGSDLRDPWSRN